MEWVTITAATMEDAKAMALDQLGVAAEDAEIEVVEEPKPGLFGRMRGEAVVRARVRPTSTRESTRRDRGGERSERGDRRGGRTRQRPRNGERRRERGPS
ncbi:MAG: Jag N-terminal domain-containing protein, partial [Ilumatobacteraceae bacterium]